ncbi:MAG: WbqC family protein [Pseudomonadota bacterium]
MSVLQIKPVKKIVISQPLFLPWKGMFDQTRMAKAYVFRDEAQLPISHGSKKGFIVRVQIKIENGWKWLTVPIRKIKDRTQSIRETRFADDHWRKQHITDIRNAYKRAPFFEDIFETVVQPIYSFNTEFLCEFNIHAFKLLCDRIGISTNFYFASELPSAQSEARSSEYVLEICQQFDAKEYITAHGARNYLDHELFERAGVRVMYMAYNLTPYPQINGPFTPYVSILDLLFNVNRDASDYLGAGCTYWKEDRQLNLEGTD